MKPAVVRSWTIASECGEIGPKTSRWTLFQMKVGVLHGPVGQKKTVAGSSETKKCGQKPTTRLHYRYVEW